MSMHWTSGFRLRSPVEVFIKFCSPKPVRNSRSNLRTTEGLFSPNLGGCMQEIFYIFSATNHSYLVAVPISCMSFRQGFCISSNATCILQPLCLYTTYSIITMLLKYIMYESLAGQYLLHLVNSAILESLPKHY
jgi:hypothetical protein